MQELCFTRYYTNVSINIYEILFNLLDMMQLYAFKVYSLCKRFVSHARPILLCKRTSRYCGLRNHRNNINPHVNGT